MSAKLKVGIIGCGGITNKHLPALERNPDVEVVAFCDILIERAEKMAKEYGTDDAKTYVDYKELLADESIVAVHVLTPNREHSQITIDALKAGKHVMCEKPMAKTYAEAQLMAKTAKETGKILYIGYQNRFAPASLYAKKMCAAGELGEVYYAKAHALRRRAVPTWGVFLDADAQGGGPLIDIGTHALDLTLWCMDNYKPKMVVGSVFKKLGDQTETGNAWGDWDPKEYTVEDSAFGFIKMENGATIVLESSWALNILDAKEAQCTLCGTLGGIDMDEGAKKLRFNNAAHGALSIAEPELGAGGVAFYDGETARPQDLENKNFYDAIINGTDPCVTPEQAAVVTQILEAIYESDRTGAPVYFD